MKHRRLAAVLVLACGSLASCAIEPDTEEAAESDEAALELEQVLHNATVRAKVGLSSAQPKPVAHFKWTPGKIQVGMGMSRASMGLLFPTLASGGLTVAGTDAAGERRRVSWTAGRLTTLELSPLSRTSSSAAKVGLTFVDVELAEARPGSDSAVAEPAAVGWRVLAAGLDPAAVLAVRSSPFASQDGGTTWSGALELDIASGTASIPEGGLEVEYLDASGAWLSSVAFAFTKPATVMSHSGYATVTVEPTEIWFPLAP